MRKRSERRGKRKQKRKKRSKQRNKLKKTRKRNKKGKGGENKQWLRSFSVKHEMRTGGFLELEENKHARTHTHTLRQSSTQTTIFKTQKIKKSQIKKMTGC